MIHNFELMAVDILGQADFADVGQEKRGTELITCAKRWLDYLGYDLITLV